MEKICSFVFSTSNAATMYELYAQIKSLLVDLGSLYDP